MTFVEDRLSACNEKWSSKIDNFDLTGPRKDGGEFFGGAGGGGGGVVDGCSNGSGGSGGGSSDGSGVGVGGGVHRDVSGGTCSCKSSKSSERH